MLQKRSLINLKSWLAIIILSIACTKADAQIVSASASDTYTGVTYNTYGAPHYAVPGITVNCDMVQRPGPADAPPMLKAITWDDRMPVWDGTDWYVNSTVQVFVEDELGNSITFNTSHEFAAEPDIVIGDDLSNPGQDYIVGVIYNTGDPYEFHEFYDPAHTFNVVLDYFLITNAGTSSITATLLNTDILSTNATSHPHIDMWTDSTILLDGWIPALHQFAAVWSENTISTQWELMGYYDDIDYTLPNATAPFSILDPSGLSQIAWDPDVSCRWTVTGDQVLQLMDVVHTTPTLAFYPTLPPITAKALDYTEYSVGASNATNWMTLEVTSYALGRIESMNWNNVTLSPNATQWQVCALINGAGLGAGYIPKGYNLDGNGLAGDFHLSYPNFYMDHTCPAVSAGTGINSIDPNTSTLNIGNQFYMCGFHAHGDDPDHYYTRDVDATSGSLATGNYYQVNQSAANNPTLTNKALALSSSSNTGLNLLSAWSDGANTIWHKLSPNTTVQYRRGATNEKQGIQKLSLSPNPATELLTIRGIDKIGEYAIFDVTGKLLRSQTASDNKIAVDDLVQGNYVLEFRDGKAAYHFKFIKN